MELKRYIRDVPDYPVKGVSFNDKYLNIDWGVDENQLIISDKDKKLINYKW